jgi:hypothetical protein
MGSNNKKAGATDTEATCVVGETHEVTRRHGPIVVTEPGIGCSLTAGEVRDTVVSVLGAKATLVTAEPEAFTVHLLTGSPLSISEWVVLAKDLGTWAMELEVGEEGMVLVIYRCEDDDGE